MNWTAFLQDNSASIFTLIGVFLGSAITFLISYLNNRFEAKERDKDREEKRRDSRTELALELMRNDIKLVENSVDNALKGLTIMQVLRTRMSIEQIPDSEIINKILQELYTSGSEFIKLGEQGKIADKAALSLGGEISLENSNFNRLAGELMKLSVIPSEASYSLEQFDEIHDQMMQIAGKLHNLLKEKLISLRDI